MTRIIQRTIALLLCTLLLAGCGLATSEEDRLARAEEQIAAGAYRSAMIELKNVLVANPQHFPARLLLAEVSLGLGDQETAEKELTRASEAGAPESAVRPLHLRVLSARFQFTEMLASLGMETGGLSESQVFSFRGEALLGLGNVQAARENYQEWLSQEPGSFDARVGIAKSDAVDGKISDAIAGLEGVVADAPEHVDAWFALARAQFMDARHADSALSYETSLQLSKPEKDLRTYIQILAGLVEANLALGEVEDARANLERLASIVPESPVTLFLSAKLARMDNDYALAARHLQALLNFDPANAQTQLFLASMQMMQSNYAQAESLLDKIVANSPDNIQARKLLAQVQLKQSRPLGAIEVLSPLLEDAAKDQHIYELLGRANLQQGDAEAAIENFRAAVEHAPDDIEAKLNLSAAYLGTGDSKQALDVLYDIPAGQGAAFRREQLLMSALLANENEEAADKVARNLARDNSGDSVAVTAAAVHLFRTGKNADARKILDKHVKSGAASDDAIVALAWMEFSDGENDSAQARFLKVQESNPALLGAALGRARVAEVNGDAEIAVEILQEAARRHPDSLVPRAWLATRYLEAAETRLAEKMADELMAIGFRNGRISQIVGVAYLDSGRTEEALSQFSQAAELAPESAPVQLNLARTYLVLERTIDAKAALNRALAISPNWVPAKVTLALVELRQGNTDEAMRYASELKVSYPDNASVTLLEGEVYLYQQDFVKASQAFHQAVEAGAGRLAMLKEYQSRADGKLDAPQLPLESWLTENPDDIDVRMLLANFYLNSNAKVESIREHELILEADPDNAIILNNLAWQYQQGKTLDRARELASRAYELQPESGSIADTLGWILRDIGELDKSLKILTDASRLAPNNGEIQYHYAVVLSESGKTDKARHILETLSKEDTQFPSREQANSLLAEL